MDNTQNYKSLQNIHNTIDHMQSPTSKLSKVSSYSRFKKKSPSKEAAGVVERFLSPQGSINKLNNSVIITETPSAFMHRKEAAKLIELTDKRDLLAKFGQDRMVQKHKQRVDEIRMMKVQFGDRFSMN